MDYVRLGRSGLEVSRLCLGAMSFGDPEKWIHSWVLPEEESRAIIKRALDLGINFFDTANVYSLGASEEILGSALNDLAVRDEIVVATKVHGRMFDGPNGSGLSRKHILAQVDQSLERLGMEYIDLLIIHRWDYDTPIEETMEALHDVVKSGKVRYIGASAMYAWQFQKAQYTAKMNGWTPFISMQNHYNLLYREEEREMNPLCEDLGVALTPYSPLASGRLSREWAATTKRSQNDNIAKQKYGHTEDIDKVIVDRVGELAEKKGVTRTQIALAWLLTQKAVAAPVIGATKMVYLDDAVDALDVVLTEEELVYLEETYQPHPVVGPKPYPKKD